MKAARPLSRAMAPLRLAAVALGLALVSLAAPAAPAIGERIQLTAKALDGGSVGLGAATGRRTLLLLWSPESLASRKSLGEIQRFAASPAADRVLLLTLSLGSDAASLRQLMTARQLSFPVALRGDDNLGEISDERLPIALLIDAEGRLLKQRSGLLNLKVLRELLEPADQ